MTWLGELSDQLLAGLLVYGYPMLALTLLVGAIGLPMPSGLAAVAAGAMVAQERLSWWGVGLVAVVALTSGDVVGFAIGRIAGRRFVERHGRWVGLNQKRLVQADRFFAQWGSLCLLATRSLLSLLGPAVNLLAGASRYGVWSFLLYNLLGRSVWAGAYIGFGYGFGEVLDEAPEFLNSLSGLLAAVLVLGPLSIAVYRARRRRRRRTG